MRGRVLTSVAVWPRPALHACLVAVVVAAVVAEEVVPRAAELVAAAAKVVLVAEQPHAHEEADPGLDPALVLQRLPIVTRVNHPRMDSALNQRRAADTSHTFSLRINKIM